MAKAKIADKLAAGLLARGYTELRGASTKYRVFSRGVTRCYVGKAGALRAGTTIGRSLSVTDSIRQILIADGERALAGGAA